MHHLEVILRTAGTMRSAFRRLALLALIGLCGATAHAASLDPAVLPKIQAATFEVVAAKQVNDPLTYEKPLPLELLPYQERNDKYYSIGTAFAIGNNRYVTAGHVLLAGVGSLWGPLSLRDADGHVYAIDKIEKFSLRKDFVVFSLADKPANVAAFDVNAKPALNQVVYAVGNALGTGVVIRDGLYTSDTPEQQEGSWKWMRFSAAASPGNSGGPLLDKDGKLIGVVLMKSANENLNYGLPMSEVLSAPNNLAVIDERVPYELDIFDTTVNNVFKQQFALPLSLADFSATYRKLEDAYVDQQIKALLAKEPDKLFPRGGGSERFLHATELSLRPSLVVRNSNGEWMPSEKAGPRTTLSRNGYVDSGFVGHSVLFHLRKPDDVTAAQLYSDPNRLMDQLLKLGFLTREVGPEKIKITSLGRPVLDSTHVDTWQRVWQVREWAVPHINGVVVTFSLPVPDGYVTMMQLASAGRDYMNLADMKVLTDFVNVDYGGTLAQWKDYLQNKALLPAVFKDIRIDFDYDHRFSYTSKRLRVDFTPELQKITPASKMALGFIPIADHDNFVLGVADVHVGEDANNKNWINIQRHVAPSADLDDDYKSDWRKITQHQHPYDGVARNENDIMKNTSVAGTADQPILYTAFYAIEGSHPQEFMKAKLDLLTKNFQVIEH
ncbi:MAG: trypsin-like peptidase domain-containing protein [Lysobacterales bacterium]